MNTTGHNQTTPTAHKLVTETLTSDSLSPPAQTQGYLRPITHIALTTILLVGLCSTGQAQGFSPQPRTGFNPRTAHAAATLQPTWLDARRVVDPFESSLAVTELPADEEQSQRKSDAPFRAREGLFIAAMLHNAEISDEDFDGNSFVSGGGSAEIMPTLNTDTGNGFAIGYRDRGNSMEFNFTTVDHEGSFGLAAVDSTSCTYNFDYRRHFLLNGRIQPHVLVGIGLGNISVENGSVGGGGELEDALYKGLGVNLGAGASYFFHERLSLGFDLGYRLQTYTSVDGVVDGDLASDASGSGVFAALRLTFIF
ncbi:MAG: hypothetical protein ACI8QS_003436 [Planctomycetota bacterium]|jgi:hypothetical protein